MLAWGSAEEKHVSVEKLRLSHSGNLRWAAAEFKGVAFMKWM
jgi:hypothetical protein